MAEKTVRPSDNRGGIKKHLIWIIAVVVALGIGVAFAVTYTRQQTLDSDYSIAVGDEFLSAGEYEEAEKVYLGVKDESEYAENRLINLYTRWANSLISDSRDPSEILPVLDKLLALTPTDTGVHYVMASLNRRSGDLAEAERLCLLALEVDGTDDRMIRYYGDILLDMDKRQAAADHFMRYAESTGEEAYSHLSASLYPAAPTIKATDGNYDVHFDFEMEYNVPSHSDSLAEPLPASDVTLYYTVDGSIPDPSGKTATVLPTFKYDGPISTEYFYNGNPLVITAVAVDSYGMVSSPEVRVFTFNTEYTPATEISLSRTSVSLEENEQATLRATVYPSAATNRNVLWTSSNTDFVTVDENGFITAVKFTENADLDVRMTTEATVYVTATAVGEGIVSVCEVTVVPSRTKPSTSYNYSKKYLEVGLKAMHEIEPDIVGYLKIDNLADVPDMPHAAIYRAEGKDGYYLSHSRDGAESPYGEMTAPSSVRLSSLGRNTVIVSNYVSTPEENGDNALLSAISTLDEYPSWYLNGKSHYIYLNTIDGSYIFQVFSWYHPDGSFTDYGKTEFATLGEFVDFCNGAKAANQLYNTATPTFYSGDRILTLILYKDGEADTVVHGRVAKYKSTTSGVPSFFDDGFGGSSSDEPDTPAEPEIPDTPAEPEIPTDPEIPDTPVEPDIPAEPEVPALEGDLDGDGKLSFVERYLLEIAKNTPGESGTENGDESADTPAPEEGANE